jgi:tRNA A37 threonylcarbamoyladenosine dehydratase
LRGATEVKRTARPLSAAAPGGAFGLGMAPNRDRDRAFSPAAPDRAGSGGGRPAAGGNALAGEPAAGGESAGRVEPAGRVESVMPSATEPPDLERRFAGVARLYGEAGYARLQAARVAVVGIGGVGSWAAEALARSGVGAISLIDLDHIAESNTNRQIHALGDAYGMAKVQAMAMRIAAINPGCRVQAVEAFVDPDNAGSLAAGHDLVLDCIDEVSSKAALIAACRAQGIAVVTCGAAGGRIDPTRLRQDDLARASGDPLLAKVRYRLRRRHGFPRQSGGRVRRFGVPAIYSDEPIGAPQDCSPQARLACAGYGSTVAVTGAMGFAAAAAALRHLVAGGASPRLDCHQSRLPGLPLG